MLNLLPQLLTGFHVTGRVPGLKATVSIKNAGSKSLNLCHIGHPHDTSMLCCYSSILRWCTDVTCHDDLTTVWPYCSSRILCLPAVWDQISPDSSVHCRLCMQDESSSVGVSTFCIWIAIQHHHLHSLSLKTVKYAYTHERTPSFLFIHTTYYNIVSLWFAINWATLTNLNPAKPPFYPCTCATVVKHRHRGGQAW